MVHLVADVAKTYRFDAIKFREFAVKHENKFGIIEENGEFYVSTWYCDDLVSEFRKEKSL